MKCANVEAIRGWLIGACLLVLLVNRIPVLYLKVQYLVEYCVIQVLYWTSPQRLSSELKGRAMQ